MLSDIHLKDANVLHVIAHYVTELPPVGTAKAKEVLKRWNEDSDVGLAIRQAVFAGMFWALCRPESISVEGGCRTLQTMKTNPPMVGHSGHAVSPMNGGAR